MRAVPTHRFCLVLMIASHAPSCSDPSALVPLMPPGSSADTVDTADASQTATAAALSEMPLPPGRTVWSWDIVGEARVTEPGGWEAQWLGTATWTWRNDTTGAEACVAELQTTGDGQDDECSADEGCLFAMNVEHTLLSLDGPSDCLTRLGLADGGGPLDQWGLGYADAWSDGSTSADHPVMYLWSRDSKTFPGAWRPMGTATWNEEEENFSYTFDTLWFFIVEE